MSVFLFSGMLVREGRVLEFCPTLYFLSQCDQPCFFLVFFMDHAGKIPSIELAGKTKSRAQ